MFAGLIKTVIKRRTCDTVYIKRIPLLIIFLGISNVSILKAQDSASVAYHPIAGFSINSGLRYLVVKDEYISMEKYSGSSAFFALDWTKYHETYYFDFNFDFISAAKINNYNVSANVTELDLSLSYLYPIGTLNILNRKAQFYIGPMPELFYHYRYENIAMLPSSKTLLISAGIRIDMFYPIDRRWNIESHMQSTIISLDQGESSDPGTGGDSSQSEIITLFSGLRYSFSAAVRYLLIKNISIKAGYQYNLVRSTAWDYFISSSDNLTASLTYSF